MIAVFTTNDAVARMTGGPTAHLIAIGFMIVSLLVPSLALIYIRIFRRAGWKWALAGLVISILGWGSFMILWIFFLPPLGAAR
jgi:hypothetical protein